MFILCNHAKPLVSACVKSTFIFVFQRDDICSLSTYDGISATYSHPLAAKTAGSESKISHDSKHSTVCSLSAAGSLMSLWNSSSTGRVNKVVRRPKRRSSQFDEDQENIDPAAVCDSITISDQSEAFEKPGSSYWTPAFKKHCGVETEANAKRNGGRVVDSLATKCGSDEVQTGSDKSLISSLAASSYRHNNCEDLIDDTIKSVLNSSDDRLHELIGDFSRPYCLPFVESDKHRDLRAVSCHTVSCGSFLLYRR